MAKGSFEWIRCEQALKAYAVRLGPPAYAGYCRSLLPLDRNGLLTATPTAAAAPADSMAEDELLAGLEGAAGSPDIAKLRLVRTSAEKREAEEIASRLKCLDFDMIKPLFQQVQADGECAADHKAVRQRCGLSECRHSAGTFLHPWRPDRFWRRGLRANKGAERGN